MDSRGGLLTLLVGALLVLQLDTPEAVGGAPLLLRMEVVRENSRAPAAFLDDLEFELSSKLAAVDCHEEVARPGGNQSPASELLLRISFDGFREDILFDTSIAERASPTSEPGVERRLEARVESQFQAEVRLGTATGALVRSKHYQRLTSYRPVLDEDARVTAESRMVDEVVRVARAFVCGGSEKRWRLDLERARASETDGVRPEHE